MLKLLSVAVSDSYQGVGVSIEDFADLPYGPGRRLRNGLIKNAGSNPIRISTGSVVVAEESMPIQV